MNLRGTVLFAFVASISLAAVGCASTGGASLPLTDSVSAALLSPKQVQSDYGYSFSQNPFVAPGPSILPTYYDFLVVRLTISATAATEFELLKAKAEDLDGATRASYANREEFTHYIDQVSMPATSSATMRHDKVGWYYLPADKFQVKPGRHSYVIVLIGKHPIGNNVTIDLLLSLAGNIQSLQIPVPNAKTD